MRLNAGQLFLVDWGRGVCAHARVYKCAHACVRACDVPVARARLPSWQELEAPYFIRHLFPRRSPVKAYHENVAEGRVLVEDFNLKVS